jgi:hypothetical protein
MKRDLKEWQQIHRMVNRQLKVLNELVEEKEEELENIEIEIKKAS